jgi:hypothetical protein
MLMQKLAFIVLNITLITLLVLKRCTSFVLGSSLIFMLSRQQWCCHNPNLGLVTKAKACKVASQEGSPGVTSHAPGSAKECEGVNLHTPK